MRRDELFQFLRRYGLGVLATVATDGSPQAAVVGVAVTDDLEIVLDTLDTSRKHHNLRSDPRAALVIGWDDEITVQLDGHADFPTGRDLERIRECYLAAHPGGRERLAWPGITHVRVRPTWGRYSDFTHDPPQIVEFAVEQLA